MRFLFRVNRHIILFVAAKQEVNIVIADLPGEVSDITETLTVPADGGIIITKDWDEMGVWDRVLIRCGVRKIAQARSRMPEEGLESVVTLFKPGRLLSGRVTGLDRVVKSWDPFIFYLAVFLLFDLLPSLVSQRERVVNQLHQ